MFLNKCVWLGIHFETTHFSKYNLLHQFLTFPPQIISHLIRSHMSMCALVKENVFWFLFLGKFNLDLVHKIWNTQCRFNFLTPLAKCQGVRDMTPFCKNPEHIFKLFFLQSFFGQHLYKARLANKFFLSKPQKMP